MDLREVRCRYLDLNELDQYTESHRSVISYGNVRFSSSWGRE
jgi:hypothetical protein